MRLVLWLCLMLIAPDLVASVYKWTDDKGVVHYSERPPPGRQRADTMKGVQSRVGAELQLVCARLRDMVPSLLTGMRNQQTRNEALSDAGQADEQLVAMGMSDANLRRLVSLLYGYRSSAQSGVRRSGSTYYGDELAHDEMQRARAEVHTRCLSGAFGSFDAPKDKESSEQNGRVAKAGGGSGTGFFVSPTLVVTSWHVVEGRSSITVTFDNGSTAPASVHMQDSLRDLAVLKVISTNAHRILALAGAEPGLGTSVFTVGFPQIEIMGTRPKLATGVISSLSGIRDDERTYQISVPVQAGNSGGPLLNERGEVVGVVAAKLNAAQVFQWTGDLPQNVNYAVKATYLSNLLGAVSAAEIAELQVQGNGVEVLAPQVQAAVVRITVR